MYQRKQQISTTRRQWRYLSSRLKQWVKDGSFATFAQEKKSHLLRKLRHLLQQMVRLEKVSTLRKALGGAVLLLGLGAVPAQAQVNFAPFEENPFGLMQHDNIRFETLADIDGDGDLDIISVSYDNEDSYNDIQTLEFRENQSTNGGTLANFAEPVSDAFGVLLPQFEDGNLLNPILADLDGDGDLDLLIGTYLYGDGAAGEVYYFQNTGDAQNPAFGEPQVNPFGLDNGGSTALTPKLTDIDGDGDLDLFSAFYFYDGDNVENGILFQENTGSATQPAFGTVQREIFGLPTSFENVIFLEFGDLDKDGDVDILAGSPYYDEYDYTVSYQYYENTGDALNPAFAAMVADPFGLEPQPSLFLWPMLGDLDNDGDLDVLTGSTYNEITYEAGWSYQENLLLDVAVEDLANELTQISVFPTVSNGTYNLQIRTEEAPLDITMRVFNAQGQLLQQRSFSAATQLDEQLQLQAYPAGTYHVQLLSGQKSWTGEVIKQ